MSQANMEGCVFVRPVGEKARELKTTRTFCCPVVKPGNSGYPSSVVRAMEIVAGTAAFILTLPICLLIALIVKIDSPGPILFFQTRLGLGKKVKGCELERSGFEVNREEVDPAAEYWVPRIFKFVKFRTMYADAAKRFPHLYDYDLCEEKRPVFYYKMEDDPRVTRAGRWLRSSTLDELPNFWNVAAGDMRLVGPRPEIPEMLPNHDLRQMAKYTVKPGVTGLAQINGRGRLSFVEMVDYDLQYVYGKSFLLDVKIVLTTFVKVVLRHGAF